VKTAFLFPGQGAQTVGMGLDLYDYYTDYKSTFDKCQQGSGKDLKAACFEGRGMDQSETVQPAIFAHSVSLFGVLQNKGIIPQFCAGLSLGEYGALCSAGVFHAGRCARLVMIRGKIMDGAYPAGAGGMLSVIGFTINQVQEAIKDFSDAYAANHLSEFQTVIAGKNDDLEKIKCLFEEKGAAMVTMLDVKVPSHAPLLSSAAREFSAVLENETLFGMRRTVYSNVLGSPYNKDSDIRGLLARQMCEMVRWNDCVEHMLSQGVGRFVEVGPSAVLSKLLKRRVGKNAEVYSVRDRQTLEQFLERCEK